MVVIGASGSGFSTIRDSPNEAPFRFDIMAKRLYKTYVNLPNVIIRVSDGTEEGKQHAVLVNAHVDSTLPSPGAADDAIGVGVMLECLRVLIHTPDWEPTHAVIFRESLLARSMDEYNTNNV